MGLRQVYTNKGLKELYKLQTIVYNAIYIRSSFQDFLIGIIFNPTFRFTACGAEILSPFRTSA
ncbi:hypothetical protein Barb4_01884 [Bacteroidales bacterium Barb4]|nr:hypothetical protein Barb4_01884 [Bacteroidales bacterium Barb4]